MSDFTDRDNDSGPTPEIPAPQQASPPTYKRPDAVAYFSSLLLDKGDSLVYAAVGICFFLGALFALGYSFWDFGLAIQHIHPATMQEDVANAIIRLISDLLLVLIIMEVLGTITHYLRSHVTSLHPFLFIGIISATRAILSIGARLSIESVSGPEFERIMIELGVNALAILALGITLNLLGKTTEEH